LLFTRFIEVRMQGRRLLNIFLVVFIDLLGFGLILPLLPYYAGVYGASQVVIGSLGSAYALAQFIGAPLLGRLSDRYGRRPVLMISIAGTVASFIILGLAEPIGKALAGIPLSNASGEQLIALQNATVIGVMFISRLLGGLTGGNITVAQAYISDVTDEKNRARGLGLIGAAFGLGFILGPVAGGLLSANGHYSIPALAAAVLAGLNLVGVIIFLPESLTPERREELAQDPRPLISISAMTRELTRPRVGPLMQVRFFFALAAAMFQSVFTLWALDALGVSAQVSGYLLGYVGLLSIIVQGGLIGPLTRRFKDHALIFWSSVVFGVAMIAWAFTASIPALLVVMVPLAFSTGVLNTVINASITQAVLPIEIGGALGVSSSLEALSRIISPIVASALLGALGVWAPGVAAALIMVLVVMLAWRLLTAQPTAPQPAASSANGD
jgi:DHA1 family tetracycline resistance protein-like MFS transporter